MTFGYSVALDSQAAEMILLSSAREQTETISPDGLPYMARSLPYPKYVARIRLEKFLFSPSSLLVIEMGYLSVAHSLYIRGRQCKITLVICGQDFR